jgi:hypothetical protein
MARNSTGWNNSHPLCLKHALSHCCAGSFYLLAAVQGINTPLDTEGPEEAASCLQTPLPEKLASP